MEAKYSTHYRECKLLVRCSVGKLQKDDHLQRGDLKQILGVCEPGRNLSVPLSHMASMLSICYTTAYQASLPRELASSAFVAVEVVEAVAVESQGWREQAGHGLDRPVHWRRRQTHSIPHRHTNLL